MGVRHRAQRAALREFIVASGAPLHPVQAIALLDLCDEFDVDNGFQQAVKQGLNPEAIYREYSKACDDAEAAEAERDALKAEVERLSEALEQAETCLGARPTFYQQSKAYDAAVAALAAIRGALEGANSDTCPGCGGEANNGHDRSYPDPAPYLCTACQADYNADEADATRAPGGEGE